MTIPSGFTPRRFEEYRADTVAKWRGKFGDSANVASDTADGLHIDVLTIIRARYDERLATVYQNAYYPTAVGLHLDSQLSLFASLRGQASPSVAECVVFGALGTTIQGGSIANARSGDAFALNASETIAVTNYIALTYGPADVVPTVPTTTIGGFVYDAPATSGTGQAIAQALADSPSGLPGSPWPADGEDARIRRWFAPYEDANGNGVIVVELKAAAPFAAFSTEGDAAQWYGNLALFSSEQKGRITAELQTILNIGSSTPGWEGVMNIADATPGSIADEDDDYRLRHQRTLGFTAKGTFRGLAAAARRLTGVEFSRVYMNTGHSTDPATGRPPHSFELVAEGGSTEELGVLVWTHHTTGTQSVGNTPVVINDPKNGQVRTVFITRPTKRYVWIDVDILRGEGFPTTPIADMQANVAQAIFDWGITKSVGFDVYIDEAKQQLNIPGTLSITVRQGTTALPTDPKPGMSLIDLVVGELELTRWSLDRIAVTVT